MNEIRLAHCCANCSFFIGKKNMNPGVCTLVEMRKTTKGGVCDDFLMDEGAQARFPQRVCEHEPQDVVIEAKQKTLKSGLRFIAVRMESRCKFCRIKYGNRPTLRFYPYEVNKKATKRLILTAKRSPAYQVAKRNLHMFKKGEPFPDIFLTIKEAPE